MSIEHRNIPEDGLHEPKGVSSAPAKRVYLSNGSGSGSWTQIDADSMKGTLNNALAAGQRVETDGTGGFRVKLAPATAYGTMNLTNNLASQAVTASTDPNLRTNSDFVPVSVAVTYDALQNMGTGSNSLIVQETGLYLIDFWCNIKTSTNNSLVGIKFVRNGINFVSRAPKHRLGTAGELRNISANGIHTFASGDEVAMYVGCTTTSDVTIEDMTFQMVYLGTF